MIKIDMSMPKNCLDCPACNEYLMCAIPINGRKWEENDVKEFGQSRPEWCPMKEQEAVEPKKIKGYNPPSYTLYQYKCAKCETPVVYKQPFCMGCGRRLKWE